MTSITLDDIVFPGVVSVITTLQLTRFAIRVGTLRTKLKIPYPQITGDPAFERAFRAHQNTLEFMPVFMPCLWISGIFFHPVPASVAGLVYLYGRQNYFNGYLQSVEGRLPGFYFAMKCWMALLFMSVSGLSTTLLRRYVDVDIAAMFWQMAENFLPIK